MSRRKVLAGAVAVGTAGALGAAVPAAAAGGPKVALITGTSSGFGYLTALTLARDGLRVFAAMRDSRTANTAAARRLRAIARDESLALEVLDIDVRDDRSVEAGVRQAHRRAGRIDVLVNNAGTFVPAILETMTPADVREVFETNVLGHLRMNRAVLPLMRAQRAGLVVQLTSGVGRLVLPFMGAYNGAKWALEAMTEATRYEVSRFGVEVVIVEPGAYSTDLVDPNGRVAYQRYLRRLTPADARRRAAYGDLADRVEGHLLEDADSPDPQQVADTIAALVHAPAGRRPLRTWGPAMPEHWKSLNDAAAGVQRELLEAAGFADLTAIAGTR